MGHMSRWADFEREGVRIVGTVDGPVVKGPRWAVEALQLEVERRKPGVESMPAHAGLGACSGCWDALPHYRGGMCELCVLARWSVLKARWACGEAA